MTQFIVVRKCVCKLPCSLNENKKPYVYHRAHELPASLQSYRHPTIFQKLSYRQQHVELPAAEFELPAALRDFSLPNCEHMRSFYILVLNCTLRYTYKECLYKFVAFKSRSFRWNQQWKAFTETRVRHFGGEIPAAWAELPASVGALWFLERSLCWCALVWWRWL